MIVQHRPDETRWIHQTDHAMLCGELATAWIRPDGTPLCASVRAAARHHDDGWAEPDHAACRGEGPLVDFERCTLLERYRIWSQCVEHAGRQSAGAGYLTSVHFSSFTSAAAQGAEARAFRDAQQLERDALARAAGETPAALDAQYPWVAALDTLSLFVCLRAPFVRPESMPAWLRGSVRTPDGPVELAWRDHDTLELGGQAAPRALHLSLSLPTWMPEQSGASTAEPQNVMLVSCAGA